jgi:hypothetical protein
MVVGQTTRGGFVMFVQVIEGKVGDQGAIDRLMERWQAEVRPGATGYLGVTAGSTPDGRSIAIVRFDSADTAAANSARPEQSAWWSEMEKAYDGPVSFSESSDVTVAIEPPSDAGFVQVMKGQTDQRARIEEISDVFTQRMSEVRPEIVGDVAIWFDGGRFVEVAYFTSEAAARAGEQQELPEDVAALYAEFGQIMGDGGEFLDLPNPTIR